MSKGPDFELDPLGGHLDIPQHPTNSEVGIPKLIKKENKSNLLLIPSSEASRIIEIAQERVKAERALRKSSEYSNLVRGLETDSLLEDDKEIKEALQDACTALRKAAAFKFQMAVKALR